jgi:hypothetical protein
MLPVRLKPSHFLQLLMVPKGIKPPKATTATKITGTMIITAVAIFRCQTTERWLFMKAGMRSYSSAISASAFDPRKPASRRGGILSSQLLDLSLELGDFIKF